MVEHTATLKDSLIEDDIESVARSKAHRPSDWSGPIESGSAEDAANALEETLLGGTGSRAASHSAAESDFDIPTRGKYPNFKRRQHEDLDDITDEVERSVADDNSRAATPSQRPTKRPRHKFAEDLHSQKKKGKRKKPTEEQAAIDVLGPSAANPLRVAGGSESGTPLHSAPNSPMLKAVYELNEPIPPLRRPTRKTEGAQAIRRIKAVEDAQQKVWIAIARKEIPKVCSAQTSSNVQQIYMLPRSTSFIWHHALERRLNINDLPNYAIHKPASRISKLSSRRKKRLSRRSASCVTCWCFGERMKERNEMCVNAQ